MAMDHDDKRLPLVVESSLVCGRYGVHEEKNEKFRQTMEDEHVLQPNFIRDPPHGLFIVLDGHGGRAAAKRASEWIPEYYKEFFETRPKMMPGELLAKAFAYTDLALKDRGIMYAGSTVVACVLRTVAGARWLHTANAGDARAVLCRGDRAIRLTLDHKASDATEEQRIAETNGYVANNRVSGVLAVSRSLGDCLMKEQVLNQPFITDYELTDDDHTLIVACDGVWDVIEDQEALELVRSETDPDLAAKKIVRTALEKGSTDNITCIVVELKMSSGSDLAAATPASTA